MKILGLSLSHNASAALLIDGQIVFSQSEERINRLKNSLGFPEKTVEYIFKTYGRDIDYVVFATQFPGVDYKIIKEQLDFKSKSLYQFLEKEPNFGHRRLTRGFFLYKILGRIFVSLKIARNYMDYNKGKSMNDEAIQYYSSLLGIERSKFVFVDHHQAHALSACFNLKQKSLIFILDATGDGSCGSVSVYSDGKMTVLAKIPERDSIGFIWNYFTRFMGMTYSQDEYKIMGLAPYSNSNKAKEISRKFKKLLWLDQNNSFRSSLPTFLSDFFILDQFLYERFDHLSGGLQMFTEKIVTDWIRGWVVKTGIKNIALSGGVFMNIKLNQKIVSMNEVGDVFVMPSSGDESTVFGACFYGYEKYCREHNMPFDPKSFADLYLGQSFSNDEIKNYIVKNLIDKKYKVTLHDNIEKTIAELLVENKIIARYKGPMEFGARALGNRSILANPSDFDNVRIINAMIKNRDFWMPFAPSILKEDTEKYIINPNKISAQFMTMTFDTTDLARKHLQAVIHPNDFTTRPQIVSREDNPDYYSLISEFKIKTGIGGILNTSFNLHGEPIVATPADAIKTFANSGLIYLALGNYMIEKI